MKESKGRDFEIGYAPAPKPEPPKHEPTPAEKATWAAAIASNLENAWGMLRTSIEAMGAAHSARDREAWQRARTSAESNLASLKDYAAVAKARARDATDAAVRQQLVQADQLLDAARKDLDAAPSAPVPLAPVLACEGALLAALPPKENPAGPVGPMFEAARVKVEQIVRTQMPYSDFAAFEKLLAEHPTNEIAIRFRRFGASSQQRLLHVLHDNKVIVGARVREAAGKTSPHVAIPSAFQGPHDRVHAAQPDPRSTAQHEAAAGGPPRSEDVHATAERGIATPTTALPHAEPIQASFGPAYNVSKIRAHIGGDSARAMGAQAYATGDHVVFDEAPDLHTAAHEAAHVVQQRAGVALKGGIDGGAGDPFEHHADRVADAVVQGRRAEPILDEMAGKGAGAAPSAPAVQRKTSDRSSGVAATDPAPSTGNAFALTKAPGAPAGTVLVSAQLPASVLDASQRGGLALDATVTARLLVAGDELVLDVQAGSQHWIAEVSAMTALGAFGSRIDAAGAGKILRELPGKVTLADARVRIALPTHGADDSFVVLDLNQLVAGAARGRTDGLRPVEAHLAGALGGVDVFANQEVKASTAVAGEPIVGWFDVHDASLRALLGRPGEGTVAVGVLYAGQVLSFAVKPDAGAVTGIVAHANLDAIARRLETLGPQVAGWAKKLLDHAAQGAHDFLRAVGDRLHLELPGTKGTWFEFDLRALVPRLWKSGGFTLDAFLPTNFHFELGGLSLGAMPAASFPWLRTPQLGAFSIEWRRLSRLLGSLPAPRVPKLELGLHVAGGLRLGLGLDLGAAWPELGDAALGFELDVQALLGKLGEAGADLHGKLGAASDWAHRWVHLDGDTVLRIYDGLRPGGTLVGFDLMKLLDGVDSSALEPAELRWHGAGAGVEKGSPIAGGPAAGAKVTPVRPSGTPPATFALPDEMAGPLGLPGGATVELFYDGRTATAWCQAKAGPALEATVDVQRLAAAVAAHWPKGKPRPPAGLHVTLDAAASRAQRAVSFAFAAGTGVTGHVSWTFEQVFAASDWTAAIPKISLDVEGAAGGIGVGVTLPTDGLVVELGPIAAPSLRHTLLQEPAGEDVWAAVYYAPDDLTVAIKKAPADTVGAMAHVRPSFLLHQLEKLGKSGRDLIARLGQRVGAAGGAIETIASKLGTLFQKIAGGFRIAVDGYFIEWNLSAQLPHVGLDLGRLLPTGFHLPLPGLPNVGLALQATASVVGQIFGSFPAPNLHLGDLLPGIHLDKLHIEVRSGTGLLGLWVDLGDVFGDGVLRSFGFEVPIEQLVAALEKAGTKLAALAKRGAKLSHYAKLGADGVLRIFDPAHPTGDRVGIDLARVFASHGAPESFIPCELHLDAGKTAELDYGQLAGKGHADAPGKVLVPKPSGERIVHLGVIAAPPSLLADLGIDKPGATIDAALYLDGETITAFASVDHRERGAAITLHTSALPDLASKIPALKLDAKSHVAFERTASQAQKMLVVSFGRADGTHGTVGWRLEHLLAERSLSALANPDALELATKGGLTVRRAAHVDLSGLVNRGTIPLGGMAWAAEALGDAKATSATAWTSEDLRAGVRIALVAARAGHEASAAGIELDVPHDLVVRLEDTVESFERRASGAVHKAMIRTRGAGNVEGGGSLRPSLTPRGIRLDRGQPGTPDASFAVFSWSQLARVAGGALDLSTLVPDELQLSTKAISFKLEALGKVPATVPPGTLAVGAIDPVLRGPLEGVGLVDRDHLAIDRTASIVRDPNSRRMKLVGDVYHVSAADPTRVERATRLELDVDVEAVLQHFLPGRHLGSGAAGPSAAHRTTFGARVALDPKAPPGAPDVDLSVEAKHLTKDGQVYTFKLEAGWTVDQLLVVVTGGGTGSLAQELAPAQLKGSFSNDDLQLTLSMGAWHPSTYQCLVKDVPGLGAVLGTMLPDGVMAVAKLHLYVPDMAAFKAGLKQLVESGGFMTIGGCALEIPEADGKPSRFYGIDLGLSLKILTPLLSMIPGLGELYSLAKQLVSALQDPQETIDKLRYAPELLLDLYEARSQIGAQLAENGWKGLALAMMASGDIKTKQLVMAIRVAKRLGTWAKPGDKGDPTELAKIPADYLEWLSTQNPDALRKLPDLDAELKAAGVDPPDDYTVPTTKLTPGQIQANIATLAAGFTTLADAKAKAEKSHNAQDEAAAKAAAEALRKQTAMLVQMGAKQSTVADTSSSSKPGGAHAPADVSPAQPFDVSKLPKPTIEQEQEVRRLVAGGGAPATEAMSQVRIAYLIQKFAWLPTDNLADLLATNSTSVKTDDGIIAIPMFEDERPFVRMLFEHRTGATAPAAAPGDAAGDAKQVASYRAQSSEVKAARTEAAADLGLTSNDEAAAGDSAAAAPSEAHTGASQHGDSAAHAAPTQHHGASDGVAQDGAGAGHGDGNGALAGDDGTGTIGGTTQSHGDGAGGGDGDGADSGGGEVRTGGGGVGVGAPRGAAQSGKSVAGGAGTSSGHGSHGASRPAAGNGAVGTATAKPSTPGLGDAEPSPGPVKETPVGALTYMDPAFAQSFVAFDEQTGTMALRQNVSDANTGQVLRDPASGRLYTVIDVELASVHVRGSGDARMVEYTLEVDVQPKEDNASDATPTIRTWHTYTYSPSRKQSYGQDGAIQALAKKIGAAVKLDHDQAIVVNSKPITSGPYTIKVTDAAFGKIDDQNPEWAYVNVTIEVEDGASLLVFDVNKNAQTVAAPRDTPVLRLRLKRTPSS